MIIHFSIDDVIYSLRWCTENEPVSIFDTRFYGTLLKWHEGFGLKVTLYVFENDGKGYHLHGLPEKYIKELQENSDWIRFMYHGMENIDCGVEWHEKFVQEYFTVTSVFRPESLSTIVRLHCWKADLEIMEFLQKQGIYTYLCPEKSKKINFFYDLTEKESEKIYKLGKYKKAGKYYMLSDIRFDDLKDLNNYKDLFREEGVVVIYGHEWSFDRSYLIVEELLKEINKAKCQYLV